MQLQKLWNATLAAPVLAGIVFLAGIGNAFAEVRVFTNREGKQVKAEYLGVVGDNVRLRPVGAGVVLYPISKLSLKDQQYVTANTAPNSTGQHGGKDAQRSTFCRDEARSTQKISVHAGLNDLRYRDGQRYYLYVPRRVIREPARARILVSVHGYSGRKNNSSGRSRVKSAATRWTKLADDVGLVVLAPQFDEDRFDNDYQRLNLFGDKRADDRLHELISLITTALPGLNGKKILLFGFSGGGQFVHRYALFHPDRIDRAVAGGAGWYVFPDEKLPYPIGLDPRSLPKDRIPNLAGLCQVPLLILVGERDEDEGDFRTTYSKNGREYDLIQLQGKGRWQRASNWVAALKQKHGDAPFGIQFETIPGIGHTINSEYLEKASAFLAGKTR